jgi:hypothetical protein
MKRAARRAAFFVLLAILVGPIIAVPVLWGRSVRNDAIALGPALVVATLGVFLGFWLIYLRRTTVLVVLDKWWTGGGLLGYLRFGLLLGLVESVGLATGVRVLFEGMLFGCGVGTLAADSISEIKGSEQGNDKE